MNNRDQLAHREASALQRAAQFQVPRVVKLVQQVDLGPEQTYLVME